MMFLCDILWQSKRVPYHFRGIVRWHSIQITSQPRRPILIILQNGYLQTMMTFCNAFIC